MEPLIVHYKNKVLRIPIEHLKEGFGLDEYKLTGKDGMSIYLFRKEGNTWSCTYGDLSPDLIDAIIDALIPRFNSRVVKLFWYNGERQVVEVSHPAGGGGWCVNINYCYKAEIVYNPNTKEFQWYYHNPSWLKDRHMRYFIELIKQGVVEAPRWYEIRKAP